MTTTTLGQEQASRILGVAPGAPVDEVKAAYRRALKNTHPDIGGDTAALQSAMAAYRTLLVPEVAPHAVIEARAVRTRPRWGIAVVVTAGTIVAAVVAIVAQTGYLVALMVYGLCWVGAMVWHGAGRTRGRR